MQVLRAYTTPPVRLLVDLGCGTARFTEALSEAFSAPLIGIEPAANMLAIASAKPHPRSGQFLQGRAEYIPLENGGVDLVFMSQVFYHLTDGPSALREIHRTLKPVGSLCIRQTTRENLDSYFYQ
jgi:ubiquinone/menaquinone biosynthesis C-methylase UbiE